ncbi:protein FAM210B, mitochondrial-like [Oppia nitens]|uniref:protein FAM210B, mitochondrial-like n=1 Tax=Oppia nitens TaxID=1686743 RepID=UPI0023D98A01|nr:protein FAM210B, mitochondrial-like [Oppia nitens]
MSAYKVLTLINSQYFRPIIKSIRSSVICVKSHTIEYNNHKPWLIISRHLSSSASTEGNSGRPKTEPLKGSFVDDNPKLSHRERLKRIIQNYGSTAIVLHIVLSLISLGTFYTIIYLGFDVTKLLENEFFERFGENVTKIMAGSGTFAVAYALHKVIMPLRITATIILTPIIVNFFRRHGVMKKWKYVGKQW